MITRTEVKEARALLGWTTKKLADEAALEVKTLEAFEEGRALLTKGHKEVLREVLERAGAHFPAGKPVNPRIRKPRMRRLQTV